MANTSTRICDPFFVIIKPVLIHSNSWKLKYMASNSNKSQTRSNWSTSIPYMYPLFFPNKSSNFKGYPIGFSSPKEHLHSLTKQVIYSTKNTHTLYLRLELQNFYMPCLATLHFNHINNKFWIRFKQNITKSTQFIENRIARSSAANTKNAVSLCFSNINVNLTI